MGTSEIPACFIWQQFKLKHCFLWNMTWRRLIIQWIWKYISIYDFMSIFIYNKHRRIGCLQAEILPPKCDHENLTTLYAPTWRAIWNRCYWLEYNCGFEALLLLYQGLSSWALVFRVLSSFDMTMDNRVSITTGQTLTFRTLQAKIHARSKQPIHTTGTNSCQ